MVDLWVNYDCDVDSEDVFERMIAFLTRVCLKEESYYRSIQLTLVLLLRVSTAT
jgi:hypothetical protein